LPHTTSAKYAERAEIVKAHYWTQLSGMNEQEDEEALSKLGKKRVTTLKGTHSTGGRITIHQLMPCVCVFRVEQGARLAAEDARGIVGARIARV
jgi:hypothetical protein